MKQKTHQQKIGQLGEDVACVFLKKHNFEIIERNYREKWGEIDIVAKKEGIIHFIEVKAVSHEIQESGYFRPEENVHPWKCKRLARTIQTYLLRKKVSGETPWRFDIMAVFLNMETRKAKIRMTENVIL